MFKQLSKFILPAAIAASAAAIADAAFVEPRLVWARRTSVPVPGEASPLHGVRIAHLSDLHVKGKGWKAATVRAAVSAINHADVDLVAITGDFLGGAGGEDLIAKLLSGLRSDVPLVAVHGNHDHVYGKRRLEVLDRSLRALGIIVLDNEVVPLDLASGRVWVGGVDDPYSQREDLGRVLELFERVHGPRILLTHYPDTAERLAPGQVALSLAGHSHGGQIRIPVLGTIMHREHARTKYGKGLFFVNGNPLFVSAGIGMSGIPMRFLNPPEVPILTFVVDESAARGVVGGGRKVPLLV